MSIHGAAFDRAEAAYLSPPEARFNPGEEDLLGERVFIPEEDEFGTVEYGEADDGGVMYSVKIHDRKYEVSIADSDLEALVEEQAKTPISIYDPQASCGHTFKQTYSACPHCGYRGR